MVLVGYASVSGSTRGVAERIAARITEHDCAVHCRPVDQVKDTTAYAAFVLGSAIHSGARQLPGDRNERSSVMT